MLLGLYSTAVGLCSLLSRIVLGFHSGCARFSISLYSAHIRVVLVQYSVGLSSTQAGCARYSVGSCSLLIRVVLVSPSVCIPHIFGLCSLVGLSSVLRLVVFGTQSCCFRYSVGLSSAHAGSVRYSIGLFSFRLKRHLPNHKSARLHQLLGDYLSMVNEHAEAWDHYDKAVRWAG